MEITQQNKPSIDTLREESNKGEIQQFIRSYQFKQLALKQLVTIYANNALTEHFSQTFKAAVALIAIPALTNLFFVLRPHSMLSTVVPLATPLLCLGNYVYFLNKDFQNYCFTEQPDAEKVREQYDIIYEYSYFNRAQNDFMIKLQNFRKDQSKNKNTI